MKRNNMDKQNQKHTVLPPFVTHPTISSQARGHTSKRIYPFSKLTSSNRYYYSQVVNFYMSMIPQNVAVLHINCKNGFLLNALKPRYGIGIDPDVTAIKKASRQYEGYTFYCNIEQLLSQKVHFDYIIVSCASMETEDVHIFIQTLQQWCYKDTKIMVDTYSFLWRPILFFSQLIGLKSPTYFTNWLSVKNLKKICYLTDLDPIVSGTYILMPVYIPLISWLLNTYCASFPFVSRLCLHQWLVVRPIFSSLPTDEYTVSVVVACRNEEGNIKRVVAECPFMGKHTEIIFVEGGSQDGTLEEIKRVAQQAASPERDVRWYVQQGKGKADAIRHGFAHARGDILMILDADLTMPAQELPKFFNALVASKGDFINGSRLVYKMESGAMPFLNRLANLFFGWQFSWILGHSIKDTLCGTKVLWAKDYKRISASRKFWKIEDPFGDFDLLFGAAKYHLKIIDMPIHYKRRTYGSTNIRRFWHGCILLWMSFKAIRIFKCR